MSSEPLWLRGRGRWRGVSPILRPLVYARVLRAGGPALIFLRIFLYQSPQPLYESLALNWRK